MKPYRGPPMTLGVAAAARVRLIVWCKECVRQVEPDPGEMAARYGADTSVLEWRQRRLVMPRLRVVRGGSSGRILLQPRAKRASPPEKRSQ